MLRSQIYLLQVIFILSSAMCYAQIDPWKITASKIDTAKYYGVTVANGMIGVVSSPEPFKVKNVILAGVDILI